MSNAPAGWYAEPTNRATLRYWDGQSWTRWICSEQTPGHSVEQFGARLSSLGRNITWILFGSVFLFVSLLLFI